MAQASGNQSSLGSLMFRDTALRKMTSAEDLDRYLQVTNPSAWVLIGAVAVLLVAAIIWGCTASLPLTTTTTGVVKDGQVVCFLPLENGAIATQQSKVTAAGHETHIVSVDDNPFSQREVASVIGNDYTVASLDLAKWSYQVIVALPEGVSSWDNGDDVPIQITVREVAPFSYLFGGARS